MLYFFAVKPQLTDTVAKDLADITIEEEKDKGVLDKFLKSDEANDSSTNKAGIVVIIVLILHKIIARNKCTKPYSSKSLHLLDQNLFMFYVTAPV